MHPAATTTDDFFTNRVRSVSPHACSANLLNHMVRFLHTSDWQLGMTRHYLSPEAQSRFTDARLQAIRTIGNVARERAADFVVVAGDVFESNMVDRQLVLRALEALKESGVQFYLLPGNHDPLGAGSVFTSAVFASNCPLNVRVLDGQPIDALPGIAILSAPWRSKKMTEDAIGSALAQASDSDGVTIVVGHGQVESLAPDPERADAIRLVPAEEAISTGAVHYIALGDRHSRAAVGSTGRIWYSGAPEPTEYREDDPGLLLDVSLSADDIEVTPVRVATWHFREETKFAVNDAADIVRLRAWLDALPSKERTILNLGFEGTVGLSLFAELEVTVEHYRPMFAAIERRERDSELVVLPQDHDFSDLGLSGFASLAVEELAARAAGRGEAARESRDAVGLLYRIARGVA